MKRLALFLLLLIALLPGDASAQKRIGILTGTAQPALVLPIASPVAVWSVVRLSTWNGPCMNVVRASDGAALDIGFVNNVCDVAKADLFASASALTIARVYDQSGTANDLVQGTAANQPAYTALNEWINGIRPLTFDGLQSSTAKFMTAAPAGLNVLNHTVYQVVAPRADFGITSYYDMTDAGFTTTFAKVASSAQNASMIYQGQFVIPTVPMTGGLGLMSVSSSSTGPTQIMRLNGLEISRTRALTTQAIGLLNVGRLTTGTGNNAINDLFALVVYTTAHNSTQLQQTEAALSTSFLPQTTFTKLLVYGGTSLMLGQAATLNQQPAWQSGFGRGPKGNVGDWKTYIMSVGGQTLATEFSNIAVYNALYDITKSSNVCLIGDITNDLSAPTYASQAAAEAGATAFFNGVTTPFVAGLKAQGFKVVVPTMIARGAYTTGNFKEYARLFYNVLVRNNATALGYTVSDRGGDVHFNSVAATGDTLYYQTDTTHLTNLGYSIAGPTYDKPAILVP